MSEQNGSKKQQSNEFSIVNQEHKAIERRKRLKHRPVGKAGAVVSTVFGSMLTGGAGLGLLLSLTLNGHISLTLTMAAMFAGGVFLDWNAVRLFKRLRRYKRYISLFQGSGFMMLEEVEAFTNSSHRYVLNDLRKMMTIGMFPEINITQDEQLVLLNRESYERYLFEQRRRKLLLEDRIAGNDQKALSDQDEMVQSARVYLRDVRAAADHVIDKELRDSALKLESIISQIIGHVEKHPEQIGNVRRFTQLYLPTTIKLLKNYGEFENHSVKSESVTQSMMEIKDAIYKVNLAFENLFNNLFAGISMDITTDITVLDTLLAEEGLSDSELKLEALDD